MITKENILEILEEVLDPDLGVSVVALGLVYEVFVTTNSVKIEFSLTSPMCPIGEDLKAEMIEKVKAGTDIENVSAEIVWSPPWTPERMDEELRLTMGFPIDFH